VFDRIFHLFDDATMFGVVIGRLYIHERLWWR
jgi:hypothetical protein